MGSDSGSYVGPSSKTDQEAKDLFNKATNQIEQKRESERKTRNVFISFNTDDERQVDLLRSQAQRDDFDLKFNDYSVKEPFDEKWRRQASDKISLTSATIVMIGPDTANRKAVNFEIEESYRQGKKVIGVRIYKNERHSIPESMRKNGAPIVNWSLADIQRELDKP